MRLSLALILLAAAPAALADTIYVSDQLQALVRSGPSRDQAIIASIAAGAPVTVLEKNETTGFSRVQTKNGQQGWMLSEQLVSTPGARAQLAQLQAQVAQTQEQHAKELEDLRQGMGQALKTENEQLRVRATELEKQLEVLSQQNNVYQDRTRQDFLLYGGGIAFAGLLAGLIIPRLKFGRRRDNWY
ncbi:MAG: TIGR04211 family SH3 domain-containing protein [Gammaproteobacteria bacterium]|nr:TIGR04211 family SH3 domain-containing protein [Gammaproteobacteria bacterium]